MKKDIVFVNSDPSIFSRFEGLVKEFNADWGVTFCSNKQAGLQMCMDKQDAVLVCDSREQRFDVFDFFAELKSLTPSTTRVVLSNKDKEKRFLNSLNLVHSILPDTISSADLENRLNRTITVGEVLKADSLVELLNGTDVVPSVPSLYLELMDLINSEDTSIPEIGTLVAKDVGMTVKLLQVVNSSFFGLRREILTAEDAAVILGVEAIKAMVLSQQAFQAFSSKNIAVDYVNSLWQHSVTTASFARCIARLEKADKRTVDIAFTAGMLHDVGKLVLMDLLPEQYEQYLIALKKDSLDVNVIERMIFGATHAEVGAFLLRKWGLSDEIVEPVMFHHDPTAIRSTFGALTAVYVADCLAFELTGKDTDNLHLDVSYLRSLDCIINSRSWREECRKMI